VVSGGGREIYRRTDIDRFLRRLADEGMTPEVANALDDDKPSDPRPSPSTPAPQSRSRSGKRTRAKKPTATVSATP
jgi:hypothetical protein